MADASDEVLARVENGVGLIMLNRPKAINSLTDSMIETVHATLRVENYRSDHHGSGQRPATGFVDTCRQQRTQAALIHARLRRD